jgi:hypothetical protein
MFFLIASHDSKMLQDVIIFSQCFIKVQCISLKRKKEKKKRKRREERRKKKKVLILPFVKYKFQVAISQIKVQ